jgi:hypothetical protein
MEPEHGLGVAVGGKKLSGGVVKLGISEWNGDLQPVGSGAEPGEVLLPKEGEPSVDPDGFKNRIPVLKGAIQNGDGGRCLVDKVSMNPNLHPARMLRMGGSRHGEVWWRGRMGWVPG